MWLHQNTYVFWWGTQSVNLGFLCHNWQHRLFVDTGWKYFTGACKTGFFSLPRFRNWSSCSRAFSEHLHLFTYVFLHDSTYNGRPLLGLHFHPAVEVPTFVYCNLRLQHNIFKQTMAVNCRNFSCVILFLIPEDIGLAITILKKIITCLYYY